jgi:hypothetical protein
VRERTERWLTWLGDLRSELKTAGKAPPAVKQALVSAAVFPATDAEPAAAVARVSVAIGEVPRRSVRCLFQKRDGIWKLMEQVPDR